MDRDGVIFLGFLTLIALIFFVTLGYCESLKLECIQSGIKGGLPATDIQVMCK